MKVLIDDCPYDEILNELERFFIQHVKDRQTLDELLQNIVNCRGRKTVSMRYFDTVFMNYRKTFSDYFIFTENEREMYDKALHFWT